MLIRVILFFILLTNISYSVEITKDIAVHNNGPYCVIASIETLANIKNIKALKGFLNERQRHDIRNSKRLKAYLDWEIREALDSKNISYIMYGQGTHDISLLRKYTSDRGVAVSIRLNDDPKLDHHMIVVTRYDTNGISFYDSNWFYADGEPIIWERTHEWFGKHWDGNSIVLLDKDDYL